MRTRTVLLDRVITIVVGLVLVAAGVAAWLWFYSVVLTAGSIDVGPVQQVLSAGWWPWALGAAAVVLVVLGLRRIAAHIPQRGVGALRLGASDDDGNLSLDSRALTSAAADQLKGIEGVRSARGRVQSARGQLVAALTVVADPHASLADIAAGCDRVASGLAQMTQRDDLAFGVDLRVSRRTRAQPRAR